ncbi:carbohydrate porin [Cyanobium sp. T1B-Tous]|uniref:iron uptake porin n=1 Tax=Cyanobium sp. T1B-Tous TaxID=2823721 RepID=UPI0020CF15CE|nr:iron uptake porin [Cyanobium sp. T1B-Tous]MCP9805355.1 carbohydrate porin [Cyanobium sp. T1B-Tous]
MSRLAQILLASASVSLLSPCAALANGIEGLDGAAAIDGYMQQQEIDELKAWRSKNQVTSVNQFSDVRPSDWAYQALTNLVEKYGCVAGYPEGTYKGGQAMSRFEAAALLNACLDRVTEVTDELQRLMDEFKQELAVLKGRVDGLEAKVGTLEAQQFSTTTKLKGEVNFILGGVPSYDSDTTYKERNPSGGADLTKTVGKQDRTTFNYDVRLNLDTSFTGKDLLKTRLRSGNFTASSPFNAGDSLFKLDKASSTNAGAAGAGGIDTVSIDRLYYQFPVGQQFTLTAGALVRNTEILAFIPSAYRSQLLDFFAVAGTPGVYNKVTGQGFGAVWKQKVAKGQGFWNASLNFIAQDGEISNEGIFDSDGSLNTTAQLGYKGTNWGAAVAYRNGTFGTRTINANGTANSSLVTNQNSNSFSVAGYWQPVDSGIIPSISAGYGFTDISGGVGGAADSQSWYVALQWDDAFAKGNAAGIALGQNPSAGTGVENPLSLELYYKVQVTDHISITPGLFYITNSSNQVNDKDLWGGVIQTQFRF